MEGLLPLLHLGSVIKLWSPTVVPFRGTFDHTLDAKNRLTMPAKYRAALAAGVMLAMPWTWSRASACGARRSTSTTRAGAGGAAAAVAAPGRARALLLRQLREAELDAAGRIMVSAISGAMLGSTKDVVIVGVGNRLELWDRTRWAEHRPALLSGVAEMTASVVDDTA